MIAFKTSDDWTAAQVTITSAGTDTYTFAADENDAQTAMDALASWATANAAFGAAVFSWSFAQHAGTAGMLLTLSSDTAFTATFDAEAQALLGFSASYASGTSATAATGAKGTLYGQRSGTRGRLNATREDAPTAGSGTFHPNVRLWHAKKPQLVVLGDWTVSARSVEAAQAAQSPRTAQVYDDLTASWWTAAIGRIRGSKVGSALFRIDFEAREEV